MYGTPNILSSAKDKKITRPLQCHVTRIQESGFSSE